MFFGKVRYNRKETNVLEETETMDANRKSYVNHSIGKLGSRTTLKFPPLQYDRRERD